jgi:hypothetical protein
MVLSSLAFALVHELPGWQGLARMPQLWLVYGGMGMAFAGCTGAPARCGRRSPPMR